MCECYYALVLPILIHEYLLDIHLGRIEVLSEQAPCHVEHLGGIEVNIDRQQLR